jgi:outer membrane protein TolC
MKKILLFMGLFLIRSVLFGQQIPQQYLDEAMADNTVLKEKKVSLEKSLLALKEAKSLFLPTTWFEAQYTLAKGGRSIDIPVGDLVNPVYKTLNQLTGTNSFSPISNESEQLNPNNFYDLRIKTTIPLLNPDLKINRNIQQQQISLQANEVETYKRELIKEVKTAYYNLLAADKAINIYRNALEVVSQNLRVNQSLLSNGKGLPAYVSRAESEVKQVENQLQTAINEKLNAAAYFNFLLNKPLTDTIILNGVEFDGTIANVLAAGSDDVEKREELKGLYIAKTINQQILKMNQSFRSPRVNAFLDLAAQGFDFRINNKAFFYIGGLQMQVPLFTGRRNLYKIEQTGLDARALQYNTDQVREQLQLAAYVSRNNITSAYSSYLSAIKQLEAATKYFKLIDRGYKEGVNSYIEFLDARTQITNAQLQVNISSCKVLITLADYERQTASYTLN